MAQLIFYDDRHVYEVDGVRLPSVSEILRFMSREIYGDINQYTLDNAAERGKAVHKACESLVKYGAAEVAEDIAGYVRAFMSFCKEHNFRMVHSEKSMATGEFAGTVDLIGEVDGVLSIVDIKTNSAIKKPLVSAQLNGYRILARHNGIGADALYCLQLKSDGKYRLYPAEISEQTFVCCLTIHNAMERKYERGAI